MENRLDLLQLTPTLVHRHIHIHVSPHRDLNSRHSNAVGHKLCKCEKM